MHFIYFLWLGLLSIYFPLFSILSQVCCRKMLTFYRFKDDWIVGRSDFKNHWNFLEKSSIENLKELSFHCVCHDIFFHNKTLSKPFTSWHDHLPFLLQILPFIHVGIYYFISLHIMTSRISTFLSHIHFASSWVHLFPYE